MRLLKLIYRYTQPHPAQCILSLLLSFIRGHRSHALKVVNVRPESIVRWLTPKEDPGIAHSWPGEVMDGDWHLRAKSTVHHRDYRDIDYLKQRAIVERFDEGRPWRDTMLFVNHYNDLITSRRIRGKTSISELETHYCVYDNLYKDIMINGIRVPTLRDPDPTFIHVHMGPDGEVIASDNGNHRIAIAKYLQLPSIPVKVLRKHKRCTSFP